MLRIPYGRTEAKGDHPNESSSVEAVKIATEYVSDFFFLSIWHSTKTFQSKCVVINFCLVLPD